MGVSFLPSPWRPSCSTRKHSFTPFQRYQSPWIPSTSVPGNVARLAVVWTVMLLMMQAVRAADVTTPSYMTSRQATDYDFTAKGATCRTSSGRYDVTTYRKLTCAECYGYLFMGDKPLRLHNNGLVTMEFRNGTGSMTVVRRYDTDPLNANDTATVCASLSLDECLRWLQCCRAAVECCTRQWEVTSQLQQRACPSTWDGFACWDDTSADSVVSKSCPMYIKHAIPTVSAYKTCTSNGTWYRQPSSAREWTNFTTCLSLGGYKLGLYISMACNALSLLFLVPSIAILMGYRTLRCQHRVRLHINLFLSLTLYCTVTLLWHSIVVIDRLTMPTTLSIMHHNTVACRILYVLTRYMRVTNFVWMFCEGFYLHRLISQAFEPPRRLVGYYLVGWGLPVLPVTAYSAVKAIQANKSCWVQTLGAWEWLLYTPNIAALFGNLVLLLMILRVLLTGLQSHANEPSNYRRATKATFILIPLFGLQLFLTIYRPDAHAPGAEGYSIMSALITNSQGILVALVFCLLNGEVMTHLRRTCNDRFQFKLNGFNRKASRSTSILSTQASEIFTQLESCKQTLMGPGLVAHNSGEAVAQRYIQLTAVDDRRKRMQRKCTMDTDISEY